MKFTLTRHGIMCLVRYDWEKSFARVRMNKQSIAERGWGPLNYVLLDHPELQDTEERVRRAEEIDTSEDTVQKLSLTLLNTNEGNSGETFNLFLQHEIRDETLAGIDRRTTELR
jgi:hypothetical protein